MENKPAYQQPWLYNANTDGAFILAPPFVALALVILFPAQFQSTAQIPVIYWLVLIVFIDVAHVYSTLYRTYFKPADYKRSSILFIIPIACYIVGVVLHSVDAILFWRILAYLAVFHFIRQQYGFMRLYSRNENNTPLQRVIDTIAIYTATTYPIFYWHVDGNRRFNWFTENDFFTVSSDQLLLNIGLALYLLIILTYLIKEVIYVFNTRQFNMPRNLLVAGTFLSWYFGIVFFNGDLAFTTLNVISHGIPYMALIWITERKKHLHTNAHKSPFFSTIFSKYGILYFMLVIIALAYLEEGLWDGFIWREHGSVFQLFIALPKIVDKQVLSLLIPLLALPQSTHYVLDGFIWKMKKAQFKIE